MPSDPHFVETHDRASLPRDDYQKLKFVLPENIEHENLYIWLEIQSWKDDQDEEVLRN